MRKHQNKDNILDYVIGTGGELFHGSAVVSSDEDTCGRWLGLCRYDDIDIGLPPLVLPRHTSCQDIRLGGPKVLPVPAKQDLRSAKTFVLADLCLSGPESCVK